MSAVNDRNLVNKVKNQTKNLSSCFLLCILYLRTSNRLIFWKLGSLCGVLLYNNKLSAVNDINLVNKVKNQTKNLSSCFLLCILYLRTSNRLIFWKLGSLCGVLLYNNKLSAVNDINLVKKVKNQTKNLSSCFYFASCI